MKITVRLDDITPDMNWERFYKLKAILDRYHIRPLIGVVPLNQDKMLIFDNNCHGPEDFWSFIRDLEAQGWVIAMHGCTHRYSTHKGGIFPLNRFSEFAGQPFEKQRELVKQGRAVLDNNKINTDIFMAPAHSYDNNTLKALKESGFKRITDGFGSGPYLWKGITFYPISFHMGRSLKKSQGITTMVIHTNTMTDQDMERCESYFRNPGETQWVSYDAFYSQAAVKRSPAGRLKEYGLAVLKHALIQLKKG